MALYQESVYPVRVREEISRMSPLAQQIADRWMMGWQAEVRELLRKGEYLDALRDQEEKERSVLANPGLSHLSQAEIASEYGLRQGPPPTM